MKRFRTLIVGTGSIGERHVRCFSTTGRAEVAIVEPQAELRTRVAAQYQLREAHETLEAPLADPPEVAVIATPAPWHVPQARQLLEAGVHVLIEKPLSIGMDGVSELDELASSAARTVGVAYVYRCHPLLLQVRQALQSGRFGTPVQLVAVSGQHFPTYRPAYRSIYYADRKTGGGAIQDALTHVIDAAQWLIGPIDRLVGQASHQVLPGVTVEDTVHLLAWHGGVLASYALNQYQAPNEFSLTIVCTEGTVRLELHANRWRWMTRPDDNWHDEVIPPLARDDVFIAQAHAFLDAVEQKSSPPCTLAEGIRDLEVGLAALQSVDNQEWKVVKSCQFKDNN